MSIESGNFPPQEDPSVEVIRDLMDKSSLGDAVRVLTDSGVELETLSPEVKKAIREQP